ncbi:MAG: hypothetical protein A3J93_01055 [Candidatus Magasanikbacteria bacterium RIFOXYC2_FULL_42_28]|uniref:Glycosyltransferase 2-like domain-containing protein n=1 Tax=Candidatus Magasanikbacteria bacterium RIFOXYC2_FULL_42_28 TaxID=1798704 RepID=A0A1F6NXK4_9BACT|nr:MAG: hypothetical protein A3J93_01055 [Candidatus Magasanikbacteria bacterium RIFOXYC2_FULL_42_28]
MTKPVISICIPTFNRASYLNECLLSIAKQFSDPSVTSQVEVKILDNLSIDNTELIVKSFSQRYPNIFYVKDSEPRKIASGIVNAATLGTGEYVWIFSDDDLMKSDSLKKIMNKLSAKQPDLVLLNIDSFVENNRVLQTNLFKESGDIVLKSRADLWRYLNNKFYYDIDYYTTYCSNWILKKNYYDKTKHLFDVFNKPLDMFPLPSLVFYSEIDFSTLVIDEPLVMFRADNASWVRKNPIRNFFYAGSLWRHHYNYIVKFNKQYLPPNFSLKVYIKYLLKIKDFIFLIIVLSLRKVGLFNFVRNIYKKVLSK